MKLGIKRWLPCVLGLLAWCGCTVPIATDLGETQANQAVVALEEAGVHASKEPDTRVEGRWQLLVTQGDAAVAVSVLNEENLPRATTPGVLDAMGQGSLVPSRTLEHAQWLVGTAGELEHSLRAVDGVLSVRVHLAAPTANPLRLEESPKRPSASVLLRHRGATPPIAMGDVQRLVAGAVPGLAPADVQVISSSAPPRSRREGQSLAQLGPITVTKASLTPLKLMVGAAIVLNLMLLSLLGWLWLRSRHSQARLAELEATNES